MAADEVQKGNRATIIAFPEKLEQATQQILLVLQLINLAFQNSPSASIGGFVEGTFDAAFKAVSAGRRSGTLSTTQY